MKKLENTKALGTLRRKLEKTCYEVFAPSRFIVDGF